MKRKLTRTEQSELKSSFISFELVKRIIYYNNGDIQKSLQPDKELMKKVMIEVLSCKNCGVPSPFLQLDHKIAICNGGDEYDLTNLQLLCDRCHKEKTINDKKVLKYEAEPKDKGTSC